MHDRCVVWFAVDLGSCTGVGGIRFRLPGLPSDVTRWEVLAGPQIEV